MLSRKDIENELGKGINIYPLHNKNIKGNSINFTIGKNAWSLGSGKIIKNTNGKWIMAPEIDNGRKIVDIKPGKSAIIHDEKKHNKLILLPHTTTIVETSEVIGVNNYIGGTLHSKVGIVAKGIGDIGTMLGPNFCGHLMISLHNISDKIIELPVGETFVSLVFFYLKTPDNTINTNMSGHVDKLAELGINIDQKTREYLTEDWKMSLDGIKYKMTRSNEYKELVSKIKQEKYSKLKSYFNWQNALLIFAYIALSIIMVIFAKHFDNKYNTTVWSERAYTIIISGIIVPLIIASGKLFKHR